MSRIGKNPVAIPEGVTLDITDNQITVKGKLGELTQEFSAVSIKIEEGHVILERPSDHKDHKAKHGLYRALIFNMIEGVTTGWTKELELVGVGYRASNQGNKLDLALGFTASNAFEIRFAFPSGSFLKKFTMCEYLVTRNIRFFSKSFSLGLNLLGKLSIKNPLCFLESFVRLIFCFARTLSLESQNVFKIFRWCSRSK